MALQGSLANMGIAEILQLAGAQQKTGYLHVEGDQEGQRARLLFSGGRVAGCEAEARGKHDLLGQRLLAAGLITKDQLSKALKAQRRGDLRLGEQLRADEAIQRTDLEHFLMLQMRERLGAIFEWRAGSYRFEAKARTTMPASGPVLSAEAALMDGLRMMEEWPLIRTRINNYDVIFRVEKEPEELESEAEALERVLDDAFSEFADFDDDEGGGKGGLGRNERSVLDLIDGKRTVHALIDLSRLGEFETCKSLLTLLNDGIIAPTKIKRARRAPSRHRSTGWVGRVLINLIVLGAVAAGLVLLPSARGELDDNARAVAAEARDRLLSNRLVVMGNALEAYRLEHGRYPAGLEVLVQEGLLDAGVLRRAGRLQYISVGTDYDLR